MSIWGAISDAFDFVTDVVTSDPVGDIVQAGASIAGGLIAADANRDAARDVRRGAEAEAAAIRDANARADARFHQINEQTQPGIDALNAIVAADPFELTPEQRESLDDVRRSSVASLNASGLRGAGQAQLAALRGVESDFRSSAIDSNLVRRDRAASQLADEGFDAQTRQAGLDADTGRAAGSAALTSSLADAGAGTATANVTGQTIGDVAAIIASQEKDKARSSRFADPDDSDDDDDDDGRPIGLGGRV